MEQALLPLASPSPKLSFRDKKVPKASFVEAKFSATYQQLMHSINRFGEILHSMPF